MGVEDLGFEQVQAPVGTVSEGEISVKENGKLEEGSGHNEPIKFGSHGDEMVKKEGNGVAVPSFPKDAVEEWPAPKQVHSFYFVRYRMYDDPKLKAKIEQANVEVQKKNQARSRVLEALNAKRSERSELIEQIKALRSDNQQIRKIADEKFKEIEPLQKDLKKLRTADHANRNGGLCSSEEDLDARIKGLQYVIQHESIPLSEEKKILKEIKQLENTRGVVIANAAVRAKIQESVVHINKEVLQDQVKLIGGDLEGVKKEQQAVRSKIQQLDDAIKAVDKEISSVRDELKMVTDKRDLAQQSIYTFRQQLDQQNASFYLSRNILNKARGLAIKNDVKALEELSNAEVEKFMAQWNNKDFRDDYEKRILSSLDSRMLSRDGRIRNPDEKPLVVHEVSTPVVVESATKANTKQVKEDDRSAQLDSLPVQKVQKETKSKPVVPKSTVDEDEEIYGLEMPKKEITPKDEAKLKQMKREEEIAKAKQAMERKKKKAEKAAAKAEVKAKKEAEKKLMDREKKAKKKATSANESNPDVATEPIAEVEEPEKVNENVEVPVPAVKEKIQKDKTIRNRGRPRGPDSVPKYILKRKKSSNYWVWAAPAALLVLVFLALGYYYVL